MHNWLINPNFHVILIHYPLGVFVLGALIEIFSFLWPRSSARQAARWMILLGALLMLPTIMSGMYALHDVTNPESAGPLTAPQLYRMTRHIWFEGGAAALAVLTIVVGLGASDHWRDRLHWPLVAVLVCVLGLMAVGARYGGDAVYRNGLAVATTTESTGPVKHDIYYFVGDPLQIHMILVGGLLAFTAVGLGMSIRRITQLSAMRDEAMLSPHHIGLGPVPTEGAPLPEIDSLPTEPRVASTRYWVLAVVLAAMTAGAGYWFWGHDGNADSYGFRGFWLDTMTGKGGRLAFDRTSVHVWIAMAIIAMTITLAGVIHFARPSKLLLTIFAGLLVLLLAAQFWVGILLTFGHNNTAGSLFHLETTGIAPTAETK